MKRLKRNSLKSSEQGLLSSTKSTTAAAPNFYLPDECWESVFKFVIDKDNTTGSPTVATFHRQSTLASNVSPRSPSNSFPSPIFFYYLSRSVNQQAFSSLASSVDSPTSPPLTLQATTVTSIGFSAKYIFPSNSHHSISLTNTPFPQMGYEPSPKRLL
ncbi:hypothetical protein MtrunA17_Chr4g0000891 [Medicago truncatula]|uniref:Uncharacterized protein n=1 Tax=Medicago truncatula TaxID=3880 RepID=A0A396HY61_MEDTR|nr:hypothetical protein MtrunA17_Chr4g0000891 [Medicago truncatula]